MANAPGGPLNPELHERLRELFGRVDIGNPGEWVPSGSAVDPLTGRPRLQIDPAGERYRVNCPFCGDTRRRLGFHYTYGTPDPVSGRPITWTACCNNETQCLSGDSAEAQHNREDLHRRVLGAWGFPMAVKPPEGPRRPPGPPRLPGDVTPLDRLPPRHPVVEYVRGRGFDPRALARRWGLGVCTRVRPGVSAAVHGRLVIPITAGGRLQGWQARHVPDADWKATGIKKYLNPGGCAIGQLLYNADCLGHFGVCVLVESPASVWRLGDRSVATFGKHLSTTQAARIAAAGRRRPLLVIAAYDVDRADVAARGKDLLKNLCAVAGDLRRGGGNLVRVGLPVGGRDPGDYGREFAWQMLLSRVRAAGVDPAPYLRADPAATEADRHASSDEATEIPPDPRAGDGPAGPDPGAAQGAGLVPRLRPA